MIGKFDIPRTRGSLGRKIDTWNFYIPDEGRARIDIYLNSRDGSVGFIARSDHPMLSGKEWAETDIERLGQTVQRDIEAIVKDNTGSKWQPAIVVEAAPDGSKGGLSREIAIRFKTSRVTLDTETPRGNDGRRRILSEGRPTIVAERAFSDETHLESGGLSYRLESNAGRSVIPETADLCERLDAIFRTLEDFGERLARATGPDRADPANLPGPQDLVTMMQEAADSADR